MSRQTMLQFFFLLGVTLPTALSVNWLPARQTPTSYLPDGQGFTLKPTNGPQIQINNREPHRMLRRQGESMGLDTCGFIDANAAYSITCASSQACVHNSSASVFGCCSVTRSANGDLNLVGFCDVDDAPQTNCYASSETDLCTGACTKSAIICSDPSAPQCRRIIKAGNGAGDPVSYTYFDCMASDANTNVVLQYTYTTSGSVISDPLFQLPSAITPSYSRPGISTPSSTTTKPPPRANASAVDSPTKPTGKKSNTGAIAGGVVGGLAAVGILVGVVIWFLIKRKQKARRESVMEVRHDSYIPEKN